MAEKVREAMDLPEEYDKQAFEDMVLLNFKAHRDAIKKLQERVNKLEEGGK